MPKHLSSYYSAPYKSLYKSYFSTILGIPVGETNHKTSLRIPIKIYFSWDILKSTFFTDMGHGWRVTI